MVVSFFLILFLPFQYFGFSFSPNFPASVLVPGGSHYNCSRLFHLQAKHTQENCETWGVNGETGTLVDMKELGIWEPLAVKLQTYKTAVEVRHPKTPVLIPRYPETHECGPISGSG